MKWWLIIMALSITFILSGCDSLMYVSSPSTLTTLNGTSYDPSRSFELVSFCSSSSFDSNVDPALLNCGVGNITDVFFNNVSSVWSCMSCSFDSSKCSTTTINNITLYAGLNLTATHIISSGYDGVFAVMCCNSVGSQCYRPNVLSGNGSYAACGAGYNELIGSITFNNVSNNWSVTTCLNGFK
jgi:hypothetical protein